MRSSRAPLGSIALPRPLAGLGSVHRPGRRCVCELGDRIPDPAPDRYAVEIVGGCQLIGARFAFLERLLAIALEHQIGGASDIDLGYHAAKTERRVSIADVGGEELD